MGNQTLKDKTEGKNMAAFLAQAQKDMGDDVASLGGTLSQSDRIPTNLFPLDLALGGGFPVNKATVIYGPESSGKTNIALLAIASFQRMYPKLICLFIDVENSYDPVWAGFLGVNPSKIVVFKPSYGEQVVDIVDSAMHTSDCGLVVVDSLAAIMTTREANNSAEVMNVGGNTQVVGGLVRKTTLALMQAEKQGHKTSLIYINQIRSKVGVVMGNPETLPGGNAPKFQANMVLRVQGKNEILAKVSKTMPVIKDTSFRVIKWKCPILANEGRFRMVTLPHGPWKVGQCDDFNTVSAFLKGMGQFEKGEKGKGWVICGKPYDTIEPFEKRIYEDPAFGAAVRAKIIQAQLTSGALLEEGATGAKD